MCTTSGEDSSFVVIEKAVGEIRKEVKQIAANLSAGSLGLQKKDGKTLNFPCVVNIKRMKTNPLTTESTCIKGEVKHILTKKIVLHNKRLAGATKEKYQPYIEISVEHNTTSLWFSPGLKCLLKGILVVALVGLVLWGGCSLVMYLTIKENSFTVEYSQSRFEGTNLTQKITHDLKKTWKVVKCPTDN